MRSVKITSILILFLFILPVSAKAETRIVTSTDLIENASALDGDTVVYSGEVVGDILSRGDYACRRGWPRIYCTSLKHKPPLFIFVFLSETVYALCAGFRFTDKRAYSKHFSPCGLFTRDADNRICYNKRLRYQL